MQLFQRLNNEALDDDKKQNIRVINMIQKSIQEKEEAVDKPKLTPFEMSRFSSQYIKLKSSLSDMIFGNELREDAGQVPERYETLVNTIKGLDLYNKSNQDIKKINNMMNELLPSLNEVIQLYPDIDEIYILKEIYNNIENNRYVFLRTEIPKEIIQKAKNIREEDIKIKKSKKEKKLTELQKEEMSQQLDAEEFPIDYNNDNMNFSNDFYELD